MGKAVGIGGVFLHFKGDEKEVMKWYESELGFDLSPYGTGFIKGEQLVLLSFKRNNGQSPYLNIRVDDVTEIVSRFKYNNIEIINEIKEYSYGKFAQFKDPFGNIVELWEPYVEAYKKMVKEEIESYKKSNSN